MNILFKILRVMGILLGLLYLYWGFTTWGIASRTSHPALSISLTFLYAIILIAPWRYLARLRIWILLYVVFVIFLLWMILAHFIGLCATFAHPQTATAGLLAMLTIEISQIPVLWMIQKEKLRK